MLKLHETLKDCFPATFKQVDKHTSEAEDGFIRINWEDVTFQFQAGAVNETGRNGIQQKEVMLFLIKYLETLDKGYPSTYNKESIHHLNMAIKAQDARTTDRLKRGVEGYSKA